MSTPDQNPTPPPSDMGATPTLHSPLPWKDCGCGRCGLIWSLPQDMHIATVESENESGAISAEQRNANARLIVEAVNNYATLRQQLTAMTAERDALTAFRDALWHIAYNRHGDPEGTARDVLESFPARAAQQADGNQGLRLD